MESRYAVPAADVVSLDGGEEGVGGVQTRSGARKCEHAGTPGSVSRALSPSTLSLWLPTHLPGGDTESHGHEPGRGGRA